MFEDQIVISHCNFLCPSLYFIEAMGIRMSLERFRGKQFRVFRVKVEIHGMKQWRVGWRWGWVLILFQSLGPQLGYSFPIQVKPDPPSSLALALKFVEFVRKDGTPILTKSGVLNLVNEVNRYFQNCGIQFQMEEYQAHNAGSSGLSFKIQSPDDMKVLRKPFDDSRYLVVIHTQNWDHGKMGGVNAWTAMPGEKPAGAVLEAPVARHAALTAHELGHYLNLDHVKNSRNLMNPVVYASSSFFTPEQCQTMKKTALQARSSALRDVQNFFSFNSVEEGQMPALPLSIQGGERPKEF